VKMREPGTSLTGADRGSRKCPRGLRDRVEVAEALGVVIPLRLSR